MKSSAQIQTVSSFQELIDTPFRGCKNVVNWQRTLDGDFSEIVRKLDAKESILEVTPEMLDSLELSEQGQIAREIIKNDLRLLEEYGAMPILNLIKGYARDEDAFFPTDVYSFHVDRTPVPSETILCTYFGETSEIVENHQAVQKITLPKVRDELKKLWTKGDGDFESFLEENFFDLHYQEAPDAEVISLERGCIWKLAVDHPNAEVLPCVHRAPKEHPNEPRLLLIC